jgi:hypothetical protein
MRLHVVHDSDGRIVAASASAEDGSDEAFVAVPVAGSDQVAAEVDVPAEYASHDLATLCNQFRVDADHRRLVRAEEPDTTR